MFALAGERMGLVSSPPDSDRGGTALTLPELLALDGHYTAQLSLYASGAATLTQFNAILVALHAALLTQSMPRDIKLAVFVAFILHTIAAFIFCYALRPVTGKVKHEKLLDDSIANYRRGWRATMLAMTASALAVLWFVLTQTELRYLLRP